MKIKLLFLAILFYSINTFSQSILEENFTGPNLPDGWSLSSNSSNPDDRWVFQDQYDDIEILESTTEAQNEWVYLPELSLQSYSSMYFNFSLWLYNKDSFTINKTCKVNVMVSNDGGATWSKEWSTDQIAESEFNGHFLYYKTWSISLNQYTGTGKPNVKIAFQYLSTGTKSDNEYSYASLIRVNASGNSITSFKELKETYLTWHPVANFTGTYEIKYGPVNSNPDNIQNILVTGLTGVSYTFPTPQCRYGAYIRTNDGASVGEWVSVNSENRAINIHSIPSTESCTISWGGESSSYDIEYGLKNFILGNGTRINNITSKTIDINSLQPNTTYTIYIKPSCMEQWRIAEFTTASLSITDINKNQASFYPNPVKDKVYSTSVISNIKIYDQSGKLIFNQAESTKEIDLSKFKRGSYILTAENENKVLIKKNLIKN